MKTLLKTCVLALIAVGIWSCNQGGEADPIFYDYVLNLSFQDTSGNDLVLGLENDPESGALTNDLYVLDFVVSEPCSNWDNSIYNTPARPGFTPDVNRPVIQIQRYNGENYLHNKFGIPMGGCPPQKMLTYKLKCPHVFKDNETHEIVAYWDISNDPQKGQIFGKCIRIEFEGQVITPTHSEIETWYNTATVVLNK